MLSLINIGECFVNKFSRFSIGKSIVGYLPLLLGDLRQNKQVYRLLKNNDKEYVIKSSTMSGDSTTKTAITQF